MIKYVLTFIIFIILISVVFSSVFEMGMIFVEKAHMDAAMNTAAQMAILDSMDNDQWSVVHKKVTFQDFKYYFYKSYCETQDMVYIDIKGYYSGDTVTFHTRKGNQDYEVSLKQVPGSENEIDIDIGTCYSFGTSVFRIFNGTALQKEFQLKSKKRQQLFQTV